MLANPNDMVTLILKLNAYSSPDIGMHAIIFYFNNFIIIIYYNLCQNSLGLTNITYPSFLRNNIYTKICQG